LQAWRTATTHRLAGYTRLSTDGGLVCASTYSDAFAFSAHDGTLRWTYPSASGLGHTTVHAGRVYIQDNPRGLFALDARTGRQRWIYSKCHLMDFAVGDTHLFVRVSSGRGWKLQALRASDGTGERVLALPGGMHDLMALADNGVAYVNRDNRLAAVRIDDGAELWRTGPRAGTPQDADPLVWRPAVATSDRLFYARHVFERGLHSMIVSALDAGSGAKLWEWRGPQQPRPERYGISMTPALGNLIVSTCDGIYALAGGDGQPLWHIPTGFNPAGRAPLVVRLEQAGRG
jgi:outer membrane protein assembly factor BamB